MNRIYNKAKHLKLIESLIDDLSKQRKFLIPTFLLRAQLIEFALKYLLLHAPYKPKKGLGKKEINNMTMGQVIGKLEECEDSHFEEILDLSKTFLSLRNNLTHHLLSSHLSEKQIKNEIKDNMIIAEKIEMEINHFAWFVEEVLEVNFEEIS